MLYPLAQFRYWRLVIALLVALLVATGTYAAAASNTFTGSPGVGGGNTPITGFAISNVLFDLNDANPDQLDAVSFTTDTAADEVRIQLTSTGPSTTAGIGCTSGNGTDWTCDLSSDATTATGLIDFQVFASAQG